MLDVRLRADDEVGKVSGRLLASADLDFEDFCSVSLFRDTVLAQGGGLEMIRAVSSLGMWIVASDHQNFIGH